LRRKIIAGNWKMNKTCAETREFISAFIRHGNVRADVETIICPPFTALVTAQDALNGSGIGLGAQDVFWKSQGAYTGQVSPPMLAELGVTYVIVGHSERRGRFGVPESDFDGPILLHFGDTDSSVSRKLRTALDSGIIPICCVGETFGERRSGRTDEVVSLQTENALQGVAAERVGGLLFAYEPVWAIGTGEVCDSAEANRVCGLIRSTVSRLYGDEAGGQVRIQYGGSVKPDNAQDLLAQPEIDGALVGGASLKPADFAAIVNACPTS
jgi:triosephosphate isomerase